MPHKPESGWTEDLDKQLEDLYLRKLWPTLKIAAALGKKKVNVTTRVTKLKLVREKIPHSRVLSRPQMSFTTDAERIANVDDFLMENAML